MFSLSRLVCDRMTVAPRRADRAPGRCWAVGGLLAGKDPSGRFFVFNLASAPIRGSNLLRNALANAQGPENIVIAGGSLVGKEDCQEVGTRDAAWGEVEAAAHALPVRAAYAGGTAVSAVI